MDEQFVITLGSEMFRMAALIAGPAMLIGMAVGILMAIFQAITSVQEQTLTMIPKIVAVTVTLIVMMPWILETLVAFSTDVFGAIADAAY